MGLLASTVNKIINIEFEYGFGGKSRWLIRCRLGSEYCLPNNDPAWPISNCYVIM